MINKKFPLAFLPTPIHKLHNLSLLYPEYNIYIKRDDQTGLASGGNKTRKLEYIIQKAIDSGADTIITGGAQQSNHCRQTAAACAVANLDCHLMLGGYEPEAYQGNLLLSKMCGATIHFTGEHRKGEDIPTLFNTLKTDGKIPYIVPYGGSDETGALGYFNAISELKDQLEQMNMVPDYIFFASSSGGTQAGLLLGLKHYNLTSKLMPISIDKEELDGKTLEDHILQLVRNASKALQLPYKFDKEDIELIHDFDHEGYGTITDNEREGLNVLATTEGIMLDPVYTGRAFGAMLNYVKNKKLPQGSNILFWHTGGLPSNFYYHKKL